MADGRENGKRPGKTTGWSRRRFLTTAGATAALAAAGCAGRTETLRTFPIDKTGRARTVVARKPGDPEPVLLTNLRLVDPDARTCRPVEAILLRNGRIAEVFAHAPAPLSLSAKRVDLGGDVVSPGLIDAHLHATMGHAYTAWGALSHMTEQIDRNLSALVENGVTTARDMAGLPKVLSRRVRAVERGRIAGPRVIRCDSFVQVPGGYPPSLAPLPGVMSEFTGDPIVWVKTPDEARAAVRRLHESGADVVKLALDSLPFAMNKEPIPVLTGDQLDAIRDEASRVGMPVAAHHTHLDAGRLAARHRADTLEHLPVDGVYTDEDLRLFQDAGVSLVPTLSVGVDLAFERTGYPPAGELARRAIDYKVAFLNEYGDRFLVPGALAETKKEMAKYMNEAFTADELDSKLTVDGSIFVEVINQGYAAANLRRLMDAGVPIGCGTDAGTPFDYAGNIALELYLMNEIGKVPAPDVVRAATIGNARILGIDDRVGSIEPGKIADLVVLGSDPLADVSAFRKVRAVYQAGAQTVARGPESWIDSSV